MGSLAHRDAFLLEQRARRPHSLLLDNGNQAETPAKAAAVLSTMALHDYDGVNTGALDAGMGDAFRQSLPTEGKLPVLRAVLRGDPLDDLARPWQIKKARGHTVGVTALAPPPSGSGHGPYLEQAVRAVKRLRPQCEFLVVLSQMGLRHDQELARRCGQDAPDAIIGNLQASRLQEPMPVGRSALLPTGAGGHQVGIAEIAFPLLGKPRLAHVAVLKAKGRSRPTDDAAEIVAGYYREQQRLFLAGPGRALLDRRAPRVPSDAERCGRCHVREARSWARTKHAKAAVNLIKKGRLVAECVGCHSTRYRQHGVFDRAARSGSVDCTGCHTESGGSSRCLSGSLPTRGEATCLPCHTRAHSPRFRYTTYLAHSGHP